MSDIERDPAYLTAADWFARLREPNVSVDEMLAWQQWLAQDEQHARAFTEVEQVSVALRFARRPTLPPVADDRQDGYDASVALCAWRAPARFRHGFALAAVLAIVCIAIGWTLLRPEPVQSLRTAVGENRTETLADGSTVVLGADSALEVAFAGKTRLISLERGEAFFKVAKDPSRPFKVEMGDATVVAVGTQFNIRRSSDRTVIAVTEGRVIVEPGSAGARFALIGGARSRSTPVPLIAGEQTTIDQAGIPAPATPTDPAAATAWQSGRLAFQMETLRHVLEDVNRYARKPIVLPDEKVGNLRITATVVGGNVDGLIASMERAFGLQAIEEPEWIVLRPGRAPPAR